MSRLLVYPLFQTNWSLRPSISIVTWNRRISLYWRFLACNANSHWACAELLCQSISLAKWNYEANRALTCVNVVTVSKIWRKYTYYINYISSQLITYFIHSLISNTWRKCISKVHIYCSFHICLSLNSFVFFSSIRKKTNTHTQTYVFLYIWKMFKVRAFRGAYANGVDVVEDLTKPCAVKIFVDTES